MVLEYMSRLRLSRYLPAAWLVFLALFGGASRHDEWQQLVVPAASAVLLLVMFWTPDRSDIRAKRVLWLFLAGIALSILTQLIPLPHSVWTGLPGREPFTLGATLAGVQPRWRPLSLTPDLTWTSLFSLLPVAATLAIAPRPNSASLAPLVWLMLNIAIVATFLGVAQSLGAESLALYIQTNVGSAVGLFANRNHHAIFLSLAFPILAYLAAGGRLHAGSALVNAAFGAAVAVLISIAIIQAGSRLGLVLATLMFGAVLAAIALKYFPLPSLSAGQNPRRVVGLSRPQLAAIIGLIAASFTVAIILVLVRSAAFERLTQFDVTYDSRSQILPVLIEMAKSFAPLGSGFGSFASVFRLFEPFEMLRYTYMNQAHNDVLQVVIEGGLVGLALMATALILLMRQAMAVAVAPRSEERMIGVVGVLIIAALFLASLVDYPLRTPLLAALLVFAAVFTLSSYQPEPKSELPSQGPAPR